MITLYYNELALISKRTVRKVHIQPQLCGLKVKMTNAFIFHCKRLV